MAKRSFRDPVLNILRSWGYVQSNSAGDIARDEPDDFSLEIGKWRFNGTAWEPVPQGELDTESITQGRLEAKSDLSLVHDQLILTRAVVMALIDELNVIRGWTVGFKAEVAAATNLANLQARVATLPTLGDRTPTQARNAILAKIDTGTVDS